ncbi:MAG TPA: DUF4388 domain-containing protein [Planctomycetota bacterium]|nr:DUF4388 domain-containing protein [Planctomycetota bacterium]
MSARLPFADVDSNDKGNCMPVSGDLATMNLSDLLQNIHANGKSGTMTLVSDEGTAKVFFREGNIAMLTTDCRPPLVEMLVSAGHITAKKLDAARKKQKGTRREVSEFLLSTKAITQQSLLEVAKDCLSEDVANLIASAHGEFEFVEGQVPAKGFDGDEASLRLSLPVPALIFEAAKRADHWTEIRKLLPTDALHFQVRDGARLKDDVEEPALAEQILKALDGSRSVKEVANLFPNRRFLTYKLIADFVGERIARPTGAGDLLEFARRIEAVDAERARKLVRRGLDSEPHNAELLAVESRLAEELQDAVGAAAAHKVLAHMHLEAGRTDAALVALNAAKKLTPTDPTLWERTLALALQQGRRQDALHEGMHLVKLYRAPGLHNKAQEVLGKLVQIEPDSHALHVEYARSMVDSGQSQEAVKHLGKRGKMLIAKEDYVTARSLYEEILHIEPGNEEATVSVEMIDKENFAKRRERKRRAIRMVLTIAGMLLLGTMIGIELIGRSAYNDTRSLISRERMIEQGLYHEAISLLNTVKLEHPFALTTLLDIPRMIADLEERAHEAGVKLPDQSDASPSGTGTTLRKHK